MFYYIKTLKFLYVKRHLHQDSRQMETSMYEIYDEFILLIDKYDKSNQGLKYSIHKSTNGFKHVKT